MIQSSKTALDYLEFAQQVDMFQNSVIEILESVEQEDEVDENIQQTQQPNSNSFSKFELVQLTFLIYTYFFISITINHIFVFWKQQQIQNRDKK